MAQPIFQIDQLQLPHDEARRRITDNWRSVNEAVADATRQHGRNAAEVRIVGVSKYVDETITRWLVEAGCQDLGENRPQVLLQKWEALASASADDPVPSSDLKWHQIGHLQRNKVKRLLAASPIIHSIDSMRLLEEVMHASKSLSAKTQILVELNVSGEEAKTGLPVTELDRLVERYLAEPDASVELIGFMAMAGWGTDAASAGTQFERLRDLRDATAAQHGISLPELSMGMSGDMDAAIAAGSTMVRIGSRLFEGILREHR